MPLLPVPNHTTFTLTFTLEVLNSGIWEDHKEGLLELEKSIQLIKFNYTLYPTLTFPVDVEIWPQAAKITAGEKYCWVRTWQFLERRWLSFSIKHEIPVRVRELMHFTATAVFNTANGGSSTPVIYFVPLPFGVRRYFGPVKENEDHMDFRSVIKDWVWSALEEFFPVINEPYPVADIRHQDKLLYIVQDLSLNPREKRDSSITEQKSKLKIGKEKSAPPKHGSHFEIYLPGDFILAGVGRVVPFEVFGAPPKDVGEMFILLSSSNLPAADDDPIVFVNVDHLFDVPIPELRKLGITHLYTRWSLGEEVHDSEHYSIITRAASTIKFNDHHTLPLEPAKVNETTTLFLDSYFSIEIRGTKDLTELEVKPTLFGYDKADREFDFKTPKLPNDEQTDFIIAITKIDASSLSKCLSVFINGEYPLFPVRPSVSPLNRAKTCTNDTNLIGMPLIPEIVVPVSLVLAAQMTLEVSMGVVGCKPPRLTPCFSRLYCLISDTYGAMAMLAEIRTINEELALTNPEAMLTGFAVDTGDVVVLFVEGPRDGNILKVWELSEEFHPKVKPVFNSSSRYSKRIYEEFLKELAPFTVLKAYVPLGILLACPAVYVRPALPNPARIAALKFGRLIQCRFREMPPRVELPTGDELRSFKLELCAPLRSFPASMERRFSVPPLNESESVQLGKKSVSKMLSHPVLPTRINWQPISRYKKSSL